MAGGVRGKANRDQAHQLDVSGPSGPCPRGVGALQKEFPRRVESREPGQSRVHKCIPVPHPRPMCIWVSVCLCVVPKPHCLEIRPPRQALLDNVAEILRKWHCAPLHPAHPPPPHTYPTPPPRTPSPPTLTPQPHRNLTSPHTHMHRKCFQRACACMHTQICVGDVCNVCVCE
jgi:hypothetical protein